MGTLILIAIVVIAILLYKRKKGNSESVLVTDPVTTDTTEKQPEYWYMLYRCDDQKTYFVGPFTGLEKYSTGEKVEGATGIFYTVTGTTEISPVSTITGITSTGKMGC